MNDERDREQGGENAECRWDGGGDGGWRENSLKN